MVQGGPGGRGTRRHRHRPHGREPLTQLGAQHRIRIEHQHTGRRTGQVGQRVRQRLERVAGTADDRAPGSDVGAQPAVAAVRKRFSAPSMSNATASTRASRIAG